MISKKDKILPARCFDLLQQRTFPLTFKETEADCYMGSSCNDRFSVVLTFCGWGLPASMQVLSHRTLCNPEIPPVHFYEQESQAFTSLVLLHLTLS